MALKVIIYILLYINAFSLIIYFKCQLFYVDDYIDNISSSEGIFTPKNPSHTYISDRNVDYTFKFDEIKHNLKKPLCLEIINLISVGYFAFKYASINEYDITIINYEKYYYCNNCNLNTEKKFKTTNNKYSNGSPRIDISNYTGDKGKKRYNTFCLNTTNDISIFYLNENKINKNYYKGKTIEYFLHGDVDNFYINNSFSINGHEDYIFDLDAVSLKIINITNKKGNLYNGEEELFENSFFNAKTENITHKRVNDDGYLMIIYIVTKPRNQELVEFTTCEKETIIYLYISQKNCTMNESSTNFCQNCIKDYGIYENNCYHKSEKFYNLYYENINQTWNECEINNNNFICSICPKGTYIKDSSSQTCEKCKKGEYSDNEDKINCEKCPIGYYSDILGSSYCKNVQKDIHL